MQSLTEDSQRDDDFSRQMQELYVKVKSIKGIIRNKMESVIQGFTERKCLLDDVRPLLKEIYEFQFMQARMIKKRNVHIFCPMDRHRQFQGKKYRNYDDEIVGLYIERVWIMNAGEIIVLFQNGVILRMEL